MANWKKKRKKCSGSHKFAAEIHVLGMLCRSVCSASSYRCRKGF